MTNRKGLSTPAFALSVAIGIAIFILAMVIFGTRFDSGPNEPLPASADEVARQDAAYAYRDLYEAATAGGEDYSTVATMASDHLDAIGDVWVPWPDEVPEGATNPPAPEPVSTDVRELLATAISHTQLALEEGDPADAPLYASILIRQQVAYDSLPAGTTAVESEGSDDRGEDSSDAPADDGEPTDEASAGDESESGSGLSASPLTPEEIAKLSSEASLIEFDRARQWLETVAPHLDSPERITDRIALLNDYTSQILDSGTADNREAFATLPDWFLADPGAETALRLEKEAYELVMHELFSYIPSSTMDQNSQIVATILEFMTVDQQAEIESFPFLTVTG